MIAEFKTSDGARWQVNTEANIWNVNWGKGDDLKTDHGILTQNGLGTYSLEPRTPKSEEPGKGFCTIGLLCMIHGKTLHVLAKGNQPISDFTLTEGISEVRYEIVP